VIVDLTETREYRQLGRGRRPVPKKGRLDYAAGIYYRIEQLFSA
jgi:hypothetical protein